jgi:hypothetical protein
MIRVNRKKYNVNSIGPSSLKISYRASFDFHTSYIKFLEVVSSMCRYNIN